MNSGDIVLAQCKNNLISKAIEWFTKSQFSHSFVIIPSILGVPVCMEAEAGGVEVGRFDKNYQNNINEGYEIWTIAISPYLKERAIISITNDLEVAYGFLQYTWFIWRRICSLLGKDIKAKNNWNNKGLICSQLVCAYLIACGLSNILEGYGKGSVSPQDLQDIMKAHPELFTMIESVRL